ncbi:MAG: PHP domain-containing protein [Lachnospiraceae bacterium]|nr:PHP domain-containing protein [Lachnospiraceae bacterium]
MKLYADLHIHTCLSPCGDDDMTPNDVIGMAKLKGLDVIAVTDHNSCLNLRAIEKIVEDEDELLVIPGLEVSTMEDIHVLCYFPTFKQAYIFADVIYEHLTPFYNRDDIFGRQIIRDCKDEENGTEKRLLIGTTDLEIATLAKLCREYGGVAVPAHINKQANSVLVILGTIPDECGFNTVEIHRKTQMPDIDLSKYKIIYSSDAHSLGHILEREFELEVENRSIEAVLEALK